MTGTQRRSVKLYGFFDCPPAHECSGPLGFVLVCPDVQSNYGSCTVRLPPMASQTPRLSGNMLPLICLEYEFDSWLHYKLLLYFLPLLGFPLLNCHGLHNPSCPNTPSFSQLRGALAEHLHCSYRISWSTLMTQCFVMTYTMFAICTLHIHSV